MASYQSAARDLDLNTLVKAFDRLHMILPRIPETATRNRTGGPRTDFWELPEAYALALWLPLSREGPLSLPTVEPDL
jgi:hypothetical protein